MVSPVKIWRNQKKVAAALGKTGRIVSWTIVRVPPAGFGDQAPYPVVVVEIAGIGCMVAQLVDYEDSDLVPHRKVVTVVRRVRQPDPDGIIPYGIKVKPDGK